MLQSPRMATNSSHRLTWHATLLLKIKHKIILDRPSPFPYNPTYTNNRPSPSICHCPLVLSAELHYRHRPLALDRLLSTSLPPQTRVVVFLDFHLFFGFYSIVSVFDLEMLGFLSSCGFTSWWYLFLLYKGCSESDK